jgi:hypothetical protein
MATLPLPRLPDSPSWNLRQNGARLPGAGRGLAAVPNRQPIGFRELMERFDRNFLKTLLAITGGGATLERLRKLDPDHPRTPTDTEPDRPQSWSDNVTILLATARQSRDHGMPLTARLLEQMASELSGRSPRMRADRLSELSNRVEHELELLVLMRVPAERA